MLSSHAKVASSFFEGIADIFDRALTPEGGGDSEAGKAIIRGSLEARLKAKAASAAGHRARSKARHKP